MLELTNQTVEAGATSSFPKETQASLDSGAELHNPKEFKRITELYFDSIDKDHNQILNPLELVNFQNIAQDAKGRESARLMLQHFDDIVTAP